MLYPENKDGESRENRESIGNARFVPNSTIHKPGSTRGVHNKGPQGGSMDCLHPSFSLLSFLEPIQNTYLK